MLDSADKQLENLSKLSELSNSSQDSGAFFGIIKK